jgi:hypothetical protein
MPILEPIMAESLKEAKEIFQWLLSHNESLSNPTTVLVGGWAVYSYNQYYGSMDIDLVTNNKTKRSLGYFLTQRRGYEKRSDTSSQARYLSKFSQHGQIDIDFANRSGKNKFEGREEELPLSWLDKYTTTTFLEDIEVPVPTRSFLLLMKMKAAWDRNWRLEHRLSGDIGWERGKLVKDYSDILALIDLKHGGNNLKIELIGEEFGRLSFLKDVIDRVKTSTDAAIKYEIELTESLRLIERFVDQVY